jgi:hypothetical protein
MEIKLIDGDFNVDEARELLIKLIEYKVNFHQSKIFSAQERNTKPGIHSIERIEDLRKSIEQLKELLSTLESGSELSIQSTINIKKIK